MIKIYGSNWVKGHRGQRSNLCLFFSVGQGFFLFVPLLLPGPWADLKGQGHRGQRSNFCISAVLGPICMKLGECIQGDP